MKIEAGMNDIVVLPVILVLIAVIQAEDRGAGGWVAFLGQLILLGPAIGFITGGIGSWLINKADSWVGVRREHQALYGIGLVLPAYTAATVAGGDVSSAPLLPGWRLLS
jgi:NhaP-type Na+/H+ or K+/H+ antiporter